MSVVYDVMGNPTGYDDSQDTVIATSNPDIVKTYLAPGEPMPSWVKATARQEDGSLIGYGPTGIAVQHGYLVAAEDTVAAVPQDIADAVKKAANSIPEVAYYLLAGLALIVLMKFK